jgi:hypothetical protein
MNAQSLKTKTFLQNHIEARSISCPVQILVLDQMNGPAEILMDTISRLIETDVSITCLDNSSDALKRIENFDYDLLVVGIHNQNPAETLSVLPYLQVQQPALPVIVTGWRIRKSDRDCARYFDVKEVIRVPRTAAKIKTLASYLEVRYLASVCSR